MINYRAKIWVVLLVFRRLQTSEDESLGGVLLVGQRYANLLDSGTSECMYVTLHPEGEELAK